MHPGVALVLLLLVVGLNLHASNGLLGGLMVLSLPVLLLCGLWRFAGRVSRVVRRGWR